MINKETYFYLAFSRGLAIILFIGFLFENTLAEYDCSAKDDGWYYDPEFCHIYWRCIHGTSEEFECASGTAWDHHENRCNWLDSVDCSRAEKTTVTASHDDSEPEGSEETHHGHTDDGDEDRPTVVKKPKNRKKKPRRLNSNTQSIDKKSTDNIDHKDHTTTSYKKSNSDPDLSNSNAPSAVSSTDGKDGGSVAIECQPTGIYSVPDPAECDAYYQCDKGIRSRVICPEKTFFDTDKRLCVEFERVFCGTRAINAANKNQCANKRDGIHPDTERDCHYYFQCYQQNKLREAKCAGDLKFNSYTGRCGPASNAPMPCGSYVPESFATKNHQTIHIFSIMLIFFVIFHL